MNRFVIALFALGMLAPAMALSDEKAEKTEVHEMDGKKTTRTKKVKHSADAKGNEVKTEITEKTELSKATGSGKDKVEKTETHEMDGKKTTRTRKVKRSADGSGNSEVKTETTRKTEVGK